MLNDLSSLFSLGFHTTVRSSIDLFHQFKDPQLRQSWLTLVLISLLVWSLEYLKPWRKRQKICRVDFFLDAFYMFFNMLIFPALILNALSAMSYHVWKQSPWPEGLVSITRLHPWLQVAILFILQDFVQYWIHRALHRFDVLWRFHTVHHSVLEMGFSAHLRYHWMENIIYRGLTFLPLSLLHANPSDLYGLYVFTILVGHLNHSNLKLNYGPLRYLLNHPTMHLWHHAKDWGPKHPHGLNFGISLSLWDGLFGTARWETPPAELPLSFKHRELYPNAFMAQNMNLRGPVFKSKTEPSRPRDEANIK